MNEKISSILAAQAREIKRLGVYTAIILVIFTGFMFLLGTELSMSAVREEGEKLPPAAAEETKQIVLNPVNDTIKEIAALEEKPDQAIPVPSGAESQKVSVIKNTEIKNTGTKNTETKNSPVADAVKITNIDWPAKGKVFRNYGLSYSQTFGDYRFHKGVDIELERGSEVMAALDGKVISTETAKGEMGVIKIAHGAQWATVYAHLSEIYVIPGERVKQGQAVAAVDQPGLNEVLEGPHLHFELIKDGNEVNPLDYLPR